MSICYYWQKNCRNFNFVSIKSAYLDLQKCMTWFLKSRKGRQKWNKACSHLKLPLRKLNTPVKTRWLFNLLQFFSITITFFYSYWFVLVRSSNITILSLFANLPPKSLCFRKLYNSRMLLFFVIVSRILLECVGKCLFFLLGTFLK
jgi:hypothetical protein